MCCSPGFNALKFFAWLDEVKPTWYTGVPTMHQAILLRAPGNQEVVKNHRLRFIRSSSSALPPTVIAELERVFGVPVIEAYGMTEAAHQMASNPLPPARGSRERLGRAAGRRFASSTRPARPCRSGAPARSSSGTERDDGVREQSEGERRRVLRRLVPHRRPGRDGRGRLRRASPGRLKEIINRGGEKISPREVDEIIMEHPAVHQCVTFAMPHDMLGEEVAAAVVLRAGRRGDRQGAARVRVGAARAVQGAEEDSDSHRDSGGRDGQAAAHRTRTKTGARMTTTAEPNPQRAGAGAPPPLNPPERLLMGPGPSNPDPRVLAAMGANPVGHLDPYFVELMDQTMGALREVFRTKNHHTLPISATGSAGLETIMMNLLEPGDSAVVVVIGYFGQRLAEMARRAGADVRRVEVGAGRDRRSRRRSPRCARSVRRSSSRSCTSRRRRARVSRSRRWSRSRAATARSSRWIA